MTDDDGRLHQFQHLPRPMRFLRARLRVILAVLLGLAVGILLPSSLRMVTRLLAGWDAFLALYLTLAFFTIWTTDRTHIRRNAILHDDGRFLILIVTAIAAFASLGAIVVEIAPASRTASTLTLAIATIVLSWAAVHTTFALHYAHEFYRGTKSGGLQFPGDDHPDYWDFVYFSFVIGMTAQVSDVGVTDKTIRRTVTAHGIISFVFNTALLALMVNIAASAIGDG